MATVHSLARRVGYRLRAQGPRWLDNQRAARRKTVWPAEPLPDERDRVAVVVVNHNTAQLLSQLVFSLYRVLDPDEVHAIVVVDNASKDASVEFLRAMEEAGLVTAIERPRGRYHGPGLNAGVNFLARNQHDPRYACEWIAVVDSDVFAVRPGGLRAAVAQLRQADGALAGQFRSRPPQYAHVSLNVLDPRRAWVRGVPPFQEDGMPSLKMQQALRRRGVPVLDFPFYRDEYFVHLGHGTAAVVRQPDHRWSRHRSWAMLATAHHFEGHAPAARLWESFFESFAAEVPAADPHLLVQACRRPARIRVE